MHVNRSFCRVLIPILGTLAACSSPGPVPPETEPVQASHPTPDPQDPPFFTTDPLAECDPSFSVKSDGSSLVITDPTVLSAFSLERVLAQLIKGAPGSNLTPLELLQRIFDSENSSAEGVFNDGFHCDSADNPAFAHGAAKICPRAEGALASNTKLLSPNDPDSFMPIALVNRSDLTPDSLETCGEYRIIYAKRSGLQDPQNRVFLIFEGSVANTSLTGGILSCLPLARTWASIEALKDPAQIVKTLENIYFNGVAPFAPVVDISHYGRFSQNDSPYQVTRGQLRISQGMQSPWEMREFHLKLDPDSMALSVHPVPVKNNPLPELFDPALQSDQAQGLRSSFVGAVWELGSSKLLDITMHIPSEFNAGESTVTGAASVNYAERAASNTSFLLQLDGQIEALGMNASCPPDDPLIAEDILHRASIQTCAGCHAPAQFLGPDLKLGCGLSWPNALGQVHIDEHGTLSPALKDLLLPRRAEIMTTFIQACDAQAIMSNFAPGALAIPD